MTYCDYWVTPDNCPQPFIQIQANQQGITGLRFCAIPADEPKPHAIIEQCKKELDAYFSAGRYHFTVPLVFRGTAFQQQVWKALLTIPFGKTCSYQQIAQQIDAPNAQRAVGTANSRNLISVIIPCHRVVSSSGKLSGNGNGLLIREWLLAHEQCFNVG